MNPRTHYRPPRSVMRGVRRGRNRYSTNRQLQNAICRVSIVTQTTIDRQASQPLDLGSRLMVHGRLSFVSALEDDSFIISISAEGSKC